MDKISKIAIIQTTNSHESLEYFKILTQYKKVDIVKIYDNVDDILVDKDIEVAIILEDFTSLEKVLTKTDIKHIICSKNLISTIYQHAQIYSIILKNSVNLLIDYKKCHDPSINKIKKLLTKNKLGKVLQFTSQVSGGLHANGSDVLTLIEYLFGDMINVKANDIEIIEDDVYGYFWIETKQTKGVLTNFKNDKFSLFELDIICENGVIKISNGGFDIKVYKADENKTLITHKEYPNTLKNAPLNSLKYLIKKNSPLDTEKYLKLSYKLLKIKNSFLEKKSMDKK